MTLPQVKRQNHGPFSWLWNKETPMAVTTVPLEVPTVRVRSVGREGVAKSAVKMAFLDGPLQGAQASGLELTTRDPRHTAQLMWEMRELYRSLQQQGLSSTVDDQLFEFLLMRADEQLAVLERREVVGQLLTHWCPDNSDPKQQEKHQERYKKWHDDVKQADVIEVFVPCPPADDRPEDMERFNRDVHLAADYLRDFLAARSIDSPVAVLVLLTKIDVRFASEKEAREALTDERLRTALDRLVVILENSKKVAFAGICPCSAFGFGRAVPAPTTPESANGRSDAVGGASPLSRGETQWLLKPDTLPEPFNITALTWWELWAGVMLKPCSADLKELAKLLDDDLESMNAWIVSLRCRGA